MEVLEPPEELEYATCDMAEASIQTNAKQQGYAVSRNKLYNDKVSFEDAPLDAQWAAADGSPMCSHYQGACHS